MYLRDRHPRGVSELLGVQEDDLRNIFGGNVLRSKTLTQNRQKRKLASRTRPDLSAQERVYPRDRHPSGVSELLEVQEDELRKALRKKLQKVGLRDHQHLLAHDQRRGGMKNQQKTHRKKVGLKNSNLKIQRTGRGKKKVTKSKKRSMSKAMTKVPNKENQKNLLR